MSTDEQPRKKRFTRREFLIAAGLTTAGLAVGVKLGTAPARLKIAEILESSGGPPSSFDAPPMAWFQISADNQVTILIPKMEMGQGIHTALAQIAAEELEVDWSTVAVQFPSTDSGVIDAVATSASNSVSSMFDTLRELGATMREMLRTEASRQLSTAPGDLGVENGVIFKRSDPTTRLTYGEIVTNGSNWEVPEEPPTLKPAADFRLIGQSLTRVDLRDKILGKAVYGYDARLPGMLYGAVARPPTIEGKLLRAAPGNAPNLPGVMQVVLEGDFAGVVAASRAEAYAALQALEIDWDPGQAWEQADIEALASVGQGTRVVIQKEGDPEDHLASGDYQASYRTPMAFHAHLEPQATLAEVSPDAVRIWTSTQAPASVRRDVAEALNRAEEEVIVIPSYLGGGFGRKIDTRSAIEAARLAQAAGKPVHVGWNRTEDFIHGFLRPPTHHTLRAGLDSNGRVQAFEHQQASGDVALPFMPSFLGAIMGADFGAWRGAFIQYNIPHRQTVAWRTELPVKTGWWRGLGLMANTFALESFMDELALKAGQDPLDFRLAHLPEGDLGKRYQRALEKAAELANWGGTLPDGHAHGLAVSVDVNTVVVQIAEVGIDGNQIRVHKVTAVVDPGLVINPDGAEAQTQGAIMMGLSSTLLEEATVKAGRINVNNFDTYPLLTIKNTPEITVEMLSSGDRPFGMGEPPIGPVAAAVANGIAALTGQRLRQLPLRLA